MKYATKLLRVLFVALTIQIGSTVSTLAEGEITNLSVQEVADLLAEDDDFRVLDLRFGFEHSRGHIDGAQRINYLSPFFRRDVSKLNRNAPWIVHCKSGHRSTLAVQTMADLGFINIIHMDGGFDAWREADLPITK